MTTPETGLSPPSVNLKVVLVPPFPALTVHIIPKGGPPVVYALEQHLPEGSMKPGQLFPVQARGRPQRMDSSPVEGFIGIDVAPPLTRR